MLKIQENLRKKLKEILLFKEKISSELLFYMSDQISPYYRVLLQRISNILTAPPSITDQDYQNMKKLIHSVDHVEEWNKKLQNKRNKVFFDRVKKIGPYYNPKEWESDYQKQVLVLISFFSDIYTA